MTYIVTAGYVTVETAVPGGRARIDIPLGHPLPEDVSKEDIERCLALGRIEPVEVEEPAAQADGDSEPRRPAKTAAKPELVAWVVEHRHEALDDVQKLTKGALWERIEAGPLPPPPAGVPTGEGDGDGGSAPTGGGGSDDGSDDDGSAPQAVDQQ